MKELRMFAMDLLAHIANENKKSRKAIEASYNEWVKVQDDIENTEFLRDQHYRVTIDQPRNDKIQAYEEYVLQRTQLWEAWKTARREQKDVILNEIIQLQQPEELLEDTPIYTKNIQVL